MTRMGFGLSVAPKFMDVIVRWIKGDMRDVDNYVDDVRLPSSSTSEASDAFADLGLPMKPPEAMASSRVLGLQLWRSPTGQIIWRKRDDCDIELQARS